MARGASQIATGAGERWFARLGQPLLPEDQRLAASYAHSLALPGAIEAVTGWPAAERVARDPRSGDGWWAREEGERRALMREAGGRIGEPLLLEALGSAVDAHAASTFERAMAACNDEALARVASGAALMAIHCRALALLAGRGDDHLFVQKYALFAHGRWPLGTRDNILLLF